MTAARNLAIEALYAGQEARTFRERLEAHALGRAAIAALEAETGEPVAPYAWCIASTNSADWCFAADRPGVELNAFMMDKDCVKTPAFPLYTAPPPAVTPGWKLVPIEPTLEMWKAGLANLFKDVDGVWKAMLEEAPKSPAAPDIGILKEVTEALAARLGTNADEWPLVRAARAIVEDAS